MTTSTSVQNIRTCFPTLASGLAGIFTTLVLFVGVGLALPSGAQAASPVPAVPTINARSYIMQDFRSGRVLAESSASEPMEPASLTKLMTAYIVFSEIKRGTVGLDDEVVISERAWRMPGSRMFIEVDTRVTVEDLLQGMIIQSGNDASVALAEHVAGTEEAFANLMNEYARDLGMIDTSYANSTGLPDPDLYTTAHDLALLARALIRDFPEYYQWYSVREFTYNDITQPNRNRLLWRDPAVDGIKTGHTRSAGFCLVTSAERDDMRLITVVLGTDSENTRMRETQKLLNYGFRFFETRMLYEAGSELATTRIWQGESQELPLGIEEDFHITVPRNQIDRIEAVMNINSSIIAPVRRGEVQGELEIRLDDENLATLPLIAIRDIEEGSFARRMADRVMMMFD